MVFFRKVFPVLHAWLSAVFFSALTPAIATDLPFDAAVQTALLNNRELRAARYALDKAKGGLMQAGQWSNPELEATGMSDFLFSNKGEAAFSVGLFQNFPLTSRLGLSRKIGRLDIERARLEIRNHERLLKERVQLQYIRVVEGETRIRHWKTIEKQQSSLVEAVKQRIAAGQASATELAMLTAAQSTAWNALGEAEIEMAIALADLKSLLGLPVQHALKLTDSLEKITTQLRSRIGDRPTVLHRPDAELLLLNTERADLEIRLAKAEAWEGIRIGVEYINDHNMDEPEGLGTDHFLGIKVSLPLPLWNNKGQVVEKQALREEMQARVDAIQLEMANSLAATLQQIAIFNRRMAELEKHVLDPLRKVEQELKQGFEEGRLNLSDWMNVKLQLAEVELAQANALARLAEAYVRLQAVVGEKIDDETHPTEKMP